MIGGMLMNNAVTEQKAPEAPAIVKRIGKMTYIVNVHFSDTAREAVADKLKRLISTLFICLGVVCIFLLLVEKYSIIILCSILLRYIILLFLCFDRQYRSDSGDSRNLRPDSYGNCWIRAFSLAV